MVPVQLTPLLVLLAVFLLPSSYSSSSSSSSPPFPPWHLRPLLLVRCLLLLLPLLPLLLLPAPPPRLPEECLPTSACTGAANYTLSLSGGAKVEVHLHTRAFFVKKTITGKKAVPQRGVAWGAAFLSKLLTLRVSPPAHPETTPRRVEMIR